jgi:hypothetical protein
MINKLLTPKQTLGQGQFKISPYFSAASNVYNCKSEQIQSLLYVDQGQMPKNKMKGMMSKVEPSGWAGLSFP